tara:strand:+ start:2413 stop:2988 length:576 start_codon:yes stop_codon:yes gene_type:complete
MVNEEFSDGESRRLLFVKPGFQRKMMIIIILVVIIAVNIVGVLCYGFITSTLQSELLDPSVSQLNPGQVPLLQQKLFEYIFPKVLIAELATILVLAFFALRLTHQIAGPVYRLEQNIIKMAKGDFKLRTVLRNRDEFSELAEALNILGQSYSQRLDKISDQIALLEYTDLTAEQKQAINIIKDSLRPEVQE